MLVEVLVVVVGVRNRAVPKDGEEFRIGAEDPSDVVAVAVVAGVDVERTAKGCFGDADETPLGVVIPRLTKFSLSILPPVLPLVLLPQPPLSG